MNSFFKNKGIQIVLVIAGVGMAIGWKFYQKKQSHDETKAQLIALCENDAACVQAVNTHFDACHEQAFQMGGRRTAASLNGSMLTSCINSRAGVQLFTAQ